MDTEKHIKILERELTECYAMLDQVNWETRRDLDRLILDIWNQILIAKRMQHYDRKTVGDEA